MNNAKVLLITAGPTRDSIVPNIDRNIVRIIGIADGKTKLISPHNLTQKDINKMRKAENILRNIK